jgi:ATP-dependent exoDNAse (exonuclease V) beta subunit/mRNA-degrading endonuclease RelE of RelBE toxin-antitoxin system
MRLFLSDSFFDKFTELPRNVQQRINDFQRKFRDNSQSASIHLEPISQFKDNSLRSARVDGEYRAILGLLGEDRFMLLWVDKHDNAYRWAQNKKFVWNNHTQSCQIIPIDIEERVETVVPQQSAEATIWANVNNEKMLHLGIPDELIPLVRTITDLDSLDQNEEKLPQDVYENLFAIFDGNDIDDILASIEEGKAKEGQDTLLSNNNKRRFVEITDDEYLAQIMKQGMEKWQIFLHPSQRKLVDSDYKGPVKVSGSAGTGKTIAAIHRLKKLCQNNEANVLFTTYTTALRENLKDLVRKMDIPSQRYDLNNIDKILYKVASDCHVLPDGFNVLDYSGDDKSKALWSEILDDEVSEFDEDFLYTEYIDVIVYNNNKDLKSYLVQSRIGRTKPLTRKQRVEVWRLKEKYEELKQQRHVVDRLELFNMTANYLNENGIRPYSHVIADEFQDFSNPELRFLRALVKEEPNDLFLTGDPFQRIYSGRKINFSAAGINVRGKRSMKLKINYRTTEEIKRKAVSVVKGIRYDDLDGGEENNKGYVSLVHGEQPTYVVLRSSSEEINQVMTYLAKCEEEGVALKDVCIASRTRQLYKDVQNHLHRENIKYQEIKNGERSGSNDGLSLCTFHSLKGLEFRIVILVGVNERSMPSRITGVYPFNNMDAAEAKEYLAGIRSLLYVAITRAREQVYIIGYGDPCELLK